VDTGIGAKLRDARNRRKVGLSEVEDATKIRVQFLRAMENEDWDSLPGGAYTRSFIRTYASYLGLDGQRLGEDYREAIGEPAPGERGSPRAEPVVVTGSPRNDSGFPRGALLGAVSILLVAALIGVGILVDGGNGSSGSPSGSSSVMGKRAAPPSAPPAESPQPGVSVRLAANAEVWVCLLAEGGQELIDGQVLPVGAEEGPFRSGSFTASFGNGEVSMWIDGQEVSIPETSSPVGYRIAEDGELTPLPEAERPTCV
jgi:hypothetical protein